MPFRQSLAIVALAALALAPLPAAAHDAAHDATGPDLAKRLSDPGTQAAVTVALTALSEALLNLKIEPVRKAMAAAGDDAAARLPPGSRLRDLAGPRADKLPGEIGRRVPRAMAAAAGMAGVIQDMLPELTTTVDQMRGALPKQ